MKINQHYSGKFAELTTSVFFNI